MVAIGLVLMSCVGVASSMSTHTLRPSSLCAVSASQFAALPPRFALTMKEGASPLPAFVYTANSATKCAANPKSALEYPFSDYSVHSLGRWLVAFAQTAAVLLRRDLVSPYIVIGAIGASFGTAALKRQWNQARPVGAPLADPGMPSSHALVGTFIATAWALQQHSVGVRACLGIAAVTISVLRVVTGHHTWAQVAVGGVLGSLSAGGWMALGLWAAPMVPKHLALVVVYFMYCAGSALFVGRKMRSWRKRDVA